jgi:LCP family protein required for cell wall assembly
MTDLRRTMLVAALAVSVGGCGIFAAGPIAVPAPSVDPSPGPTAVPTRAPRPHRAAAPTAAPGDPGASATPALADAAAAPGDGGASVGQPAAVATPAPTFGPIPGLEALTGTDGRFTILLLGSDARKGLLGERTDTIMVVTIDPNTGRVAMASLPRDTVGVPIGAGTVYGPRINGLFQEYEMQTGSRQQAFEKTVQAIEYTFGIEVDHYALIRFRGFEHLVDAIGGIDVRLSKPLDDPTMHTTKKGLVLKAGWNHLDGKTALAFARTRHSDSDYARASRQQQVIAAAVGKTLSRGLDALPAVAEMVGTSVETDLPLSAVPTLYALAQRARLGAFKSTVLSPYRFEADGSVLYTTVLKMDVVRAYFKRAFGPVTH